MKKVLLVFLIPATLCGCKEKNGIAFSAVTGVKAVDVSAEEKNSILHYLDSIQFHSNENFLFVDKSDYRLYLFQDTVVLRIYPVVLGSNAEDDKLRQGDGCTPEGVFAVRDQYPHDKWSKFIWLDYPNEDSWKKHTEAKKSGEIPTDASIGGEVGIHGVPAGMDWLITLKRNWTLGCISLKNEDVNEVYEAMGRSSKVVIRK